MSVEDFGQNLPLTDDGKIDLVTLISNEFGSVRTVTRIQIIIGEITIDGEKYDGDKLFIPLVQAKGKDIEVQGPDRRWKFHVD
jgi:hypothetical protein